MIFYNHVLLILIISADSTSRKKVFNLIKYIQLITIFLIEIFEYLSQIHLVRFNVIFNLNT